MAAVATDSFWNKLPIIVILGATGTGKSKLALQIAKKFNGEIISADAMQVYKGLDIVTNKVTAEEKREVPHHMLDYLSPGQPIRVTDFRDRALSVIEDVFARRKVPVVAGGTCYYVESLLWNVLIDCAEVEDQSPPSKRTRLGNKLNISEVLRSVVGERGPSLLWGAVGEIVRDPVEDLTQEQKIRLHEALQQVDPDRAAELHPNNVRKVIRSLNVVETTGRRHSELIKEQRAAGGNHLGGPLRFRNSIILWITCQKEVLEARLDARVDEMISQGLITELQSFHDQYNLQRMKNPDGETKPVAYTLGIFQSIGFKEFHEYLMLSEEQKTREEGQKMFSKGVELMKLATRQYAKRQLKWIRKRFLGRGEEQVPPLYALDGTDITQWDTEVRDKAFSVVQSTIDGTPCPVAPEPIAIKSVDQRLLKCEQCERLFTGERQFQDHLKSEKHKRKLKKLSQTGGEYPSLWKQLNKSADTNNLSDKHSNKTNI